MFSAILSGITLTKKLLILHEPIDQWHHLPNMRVRYCLISIFFSPNLLTKQEEQFKNNPVVQKLMIQLMYVGLGCA